MEGCKECGFFLLPGVWSSGSLGVLRVASQKNRRDFIRYMLLFHGFDFEVLMNLLGLSGLGFTDELQTCVLKADSCVVHSQLDLLS